MAERYSQGLAGCGGSALCGPQCTSIWAQYSVLSDQRQVLQEKLKAAGIPTAVYYPLPLHLQGAFTHLGYQPGDFPLSEKASKRIFSLPMHPYLEAAQQDVIIKSMKS